MLIAVFDCVLVAVPHTKQEGQTLEVLPDRVGSPGLGELENAVEDVHVPVWAWCLLTRPRPYAPHATKQLQEAGRTAAAIRLHRVVAPRSNGDDGTLHVARNPYATRVMVLSSQRLSRRSQWTYAVYDHHRHVPCRLPEGCRTWQANQSGDSSCLAENPPSKAGSP